MCKSASSFLVLTSSCFSLFPLSSACTRFSSTASVKKHTFQWRIAAIVIFDNNNILVIECICTVMFYCMYCVFFFSPGFGLICCREGTWCHLAVIRLSIHFYDCIVLFWHHLGDNKMMWGNKWENQLSLSKDARWKRINLRSGTFGCDLSLPVSNLLIPSWSNILHTVKEWDSKSKDGIWAAESPGITWKPASRTGTMYIKL